MNKSKNCKYCNEKFYKSDFPKVFHRMITCGKVACRALHKKEWGLQRTRPDCGIRINRDAVQCNVCSVQGTRNPFYGRTHTVEAKMKMPLFPKGHVPAIKGNHHSFEAKVKNSVAHQKGLDVKPLHFGRNVRNALRHSVKYNEWRKAIFIRDDFTCQNKKCSQRGGTLEAHHRITFAKIVRAATAASPLLSVYDACLVYAPLWKIKNGTTLCVKCHRRKERNFICKTK